MKKSLITSRPGLLSFVTRISPKVREYDPVFNFSRLYLQGIPRTSKASSKHEELLYCSRDADQTASFEHPKYSFILIG